MEGEEGNRGRNAEGTPNESPQVTLNPNIYTAMDDVEGIDHDIEGSA